MLRNLFNVFVLVMLLLQGVAQASVDVQPHSASMHCADHDAGMTDCPCCGDSWLGMATGCATACVAFFAVSQPAFAVPRAPLHAHHGTAVHWQSGPNYLPLIPPPIS